MPCQMPPQPAGREATAAWGGPWRGWYHKNDLCPCPSANQALQPVWAPWQKPRRLQASSLVCLLLVHASFVAPWRQAGLRVRVCAAAAHRQADSSTATGSSAHACSPNSAPSPHNGPQPHPSTPTPSLRLPPAPCAFLLACLQAASSPARPGRSALLHGGCGAAAALSSPGPLHRGHRMVRARLARARPGSAAAAGWGVGGRGARATGHARCLYACLPGGAFVALTCCQWQRPRPRLGWVVHE